MSAAKVVKIILKGDDWTFTHKYLVYDQFKVEREDPVIQECIQNARGCLSMQPNDEEIRCSMVHK